MNITHGSLFSGGGGFDLASEWMGWENLFHCEINPFGRKVLKYYWPQSISYEDIYKTNFTIWRGKVDVLTGGFPCQPFSHAGKRAGSEDDRYLWPETIRAVREIQPECIVFENVAGLFTILQPDSISEVENKEIHLFCEDENYQTNTVIERVQRRIIGTIIEEIGAEGYSFAEHSDGTPVLLCIPACAVNAPHRRDRIWFIAYRNGDGQWGRRFSEHSTKKATSESETHQRERVRGQFNGEDTNVTNADSIGCNDGSDNGEERHVQTTGERVIQEDKSERDGWQFGFGEIYADAPNAMRLGSQGSGEYRKSSDSAQDGNREINRTFDGNKFQESWIEAATRLCILDDDLSGKLDGITLSKWRIESLKMAGNAVVPDVVYQIFKAIESSLC